MAKAGATRGREGAYKLRLKRSAFVIALLVMPALLLATWFLFTSPAQTNAEKATAEENASNAILVQEQARLAAVKSDGGAQARELLTWDEQLDAYLPPFLISSGYAESIEKLAADSGVKLVGLTPSGQPVELKAKPGFYEEFQMSVTGPTAALTRFFGRLTETTPLSVVSNLNVTVNAGENGNESTTAAVLRGYYASEAPTLADLRQAKADSEQGVDVTVDDTVVVVP